jgi:hypothetical protein
VPSAGASAGSQAPYSSSPFGTPPGSGVTPPFGPANPPASGPGVEGESTTVLRPGGQPAGGSDSGEGEPTQAVRGDEPTGAVDQPPSDEEAQRTQVIRPKSDDNDQPTERWS